MLRPLLEQKPIFIANSVYFLLIYEHPVVTTKHFRELPVTCAIGVLWPGSVPSKQHGNGGI
jgi:hypothetical protein